MKIRELRKSKQLTQVNIAETFGVSQHAIASWEQGTREPNIETLCKLADLFEVTVDDLLEHTPRVDAYTLNEEAIVTEFQKLTLEQQEQVIEYAKFLQKK